MLIQSRDNQKIRDYIRLRDKKSAREEKRAFVLEGARLVGDALKESASLLSAYYTEKAAERFPEVVAGLCEKLGDSAYMISEDVSEKLCDTVAPQGIYAVASRLDKIPALDKIVYGGKFLVLDGLRDPGNIGTVLRTADAVGISGVFLCDCCDIYNPKVVRSAMGSLFRVGFTEAYSFSETVSMMKSAGVSVYAAVVDSDAESLRGFEFPPKSAVVIGNEGSGIPREDVLLCDKRITVRMSGTVESLNAATAAALFLWELTK